MRVAVPVSGIYKVAWHSKWILAMLAGTCQVLLSQNASWPSSAQDERHLEMHAVIDTQVPDQVAAQNNAVDTTGFGLLISAGDEVEVGVYGAPDLSVHCRVASDGNISIPLLGYVHIAGLTSNQAEAAISNQLRQKNILSNPQVSVFVKDYIGSQISVTGEVARPGVYSALGPHRLFDILQDAGGLNDRAASTVIISHRGSKESTTYDLPKDAEELSRVNVDLSPGDTVVVPKAGVVYVLGGVNKPGGYVLNSDSGTTLLRVIAAAGGPSQTAAVGGTKMLRRTPTGLEEVPVPLKKLLRAKVADVPLQADDIIYVPSSRLKEVLNAGALVTTAGTAAIYRLP
jgi:polysaccharide biosynthesis/export protein